MTISRMPRINANGRDYFATADAAIAALEGGGYVKDQYDSLYPWRSPCGLITANVKYNSQGYFVEFIA